jgi:hypothetical protein
VPWKQAGVTDGDSALPRPRSGDVRQESVVSGWSCGKRAEIADPATKMLASGLRATACKSVAKASKVRILHLPHSRETASDQRKRCDEADSGCPVGSDQIRALTDGRAEIARKSLATSCLRSHFGAVEGDGSEVVDHPSNRPRARHTAQNGASVGGIVGRGRQRVVGRLLSGREDDAPPGRGRARHLTVDTDQDGWVLPDGAWGKPRMAALLGSEPDVVVSGTLDNQGPVLRQVRPPRAPERSAGRALGATAAQGDQPHGQSAEQRAESRLPAHGRALAEGRRDPGTGRAAATPTSWRTSRS